MNIGIDLGTSYSSVAAEVDGKIEMIRVSTGASAFGDSFSIPTAAYLDNGRMLLGQAALNKRKLSPSCFKSEFKRDLGTTTPFILGGEEYLPEQLYTEVFLYFKNQAAEQMGEKVERAYITHPANYGNNKKRLIEKAANNAGLFDVALVDEPTAAAAGYSQKSKILDGDILLVYDLGGGTFDVAMIKKTAGGYVHLTEPLGISQCGGVDFDRAIFDDIISKLSKDGQFDMERLMKEKRFTASLAETSTQIKHQLSQAESHTEPIAVGAFDYFDYTITRKEFEALIYPYVANTCEKVKDILKNSGLVSSDIDRVLLVGGSSRVPLVRKMVQETLQKEIYMDADPELAVCQGAVGMGLISKREDEIKKDAEQKQLRIDENRTHESQNRVLDLNEMTIRKQQIGMFAGVVRDLRDERIEVLAQPKQEQIQRFLRAVNCLKYKKSEKPGDDIKKYPESIRKLMVSVKLDLYPSDSDWIYYWDNDNLLKIKKDGTKKTLLSGRKVWSRPLAADEEWVYYLVNEGSWYIEGGFSLYRIRKDGTGETRISREKIYVCFAVHGQWIYFTTKYSLKRMRTDGTNITTLDNGHYYSIKVVDDWIYYSGDLGICRMRVDGTGKTYVTKGKAGDFDILGGRIFCSNLEFGKGIYSINMNGTGKSRICDDKVGKMNICDGWLYYYNADKDKYYVVRTDGTNLQVVG